jgi:hypothetical protein
MSLLFDNVTEAESRSVSCSQARCSHSAYSDDSTRSESGALVHVRNVNIQSISHEAFAQKHISLFFHNVTEAESHSVSCSQAPFSHSACSDDSTRSESGALLHVGNGSAKTTGRDVNKNFSSHSSLKEVPYAASNSSDEVRYSIRSIFFFKIIFTRIDY